MYRFALMCLISFSVTESTSNDPQWLASVAKQREKGLKKWNQSNAIQSTHNDWSTGRLTSLLSGESRLNDTKKPGEIEHTKAQTGQLAPAHTIKKNPNAYQEKTLKITLEVKK